MLDLGFLSMEVVFDASMNFPPHDSPSCPRRGLLPAIFLDIPLPRSIQRDIEHFAVDPFSVLCLCGPPPGHFSGCVNICIIFDIFHPFIYHSSTPFMSSFIDSPLGSPTIGPPTPASRCPSSNRSPWVPSILPLLSSGRVDVHTLQLSPSRDLSVS